MQWIRLILRHLPSHVLNAETLTDACKGTKVFMPRLKLAPSDAKLPFILQRIQVPIRLSFSMTINKSLGQTFDKRELYLRSQVFSHGQLCVACSMTALLNPVFPMIVNTTTQGIFEGWQ